MSHIWVRIILTQWFTKRVEEHRSFLINILLEETVLKRSLYERIFRFSIPLQFHFSYRNQIRSEFNSVQIYFLNLISDKNWPFNSRIAVLESNTVQVKKVRKQPGKLHEIRIELSIEWKNRVSVWTARDKRGTRIWRVFKTEVLQRQRERSAFVEGGQGEGWVPAHRSPGCSLVGPTLVEGCTGRWDSRKLNSAFAW